MMRRLIMLASVLTVCAGRAAAQRATKPAATTSPDSTSPDSLVARTKIDSLRRNFAVPQAPAMTLLDVDSSKILKPSNARELGVELSNAAGGTVGIPSALAIEFSPALVIFGRSTTVRQYDALASLYRLRLSLGTKRDSTTKGRTEVAFGLRTSLIDDGDPRSATQVRDTLVQGLTRIQTLHEARDRFMRINCVPGAKDSADAHQFIDAVMTQFDDTTAGNPKEAIRACLLAHSGARKLFGFSDSAAVNAFFLGRMPAEEMPRAVLTFKAAWYRAADVVSRSAKTKIDTLDADYRNDYLRQIDSATTRYDSLYKKATDPKQLWNKNAVDVAVAMRGSSADSLGRGLVADNYSAWCTAALGLNTSVLWWFFGAQAAADRDTTAGHKFRGSGHLATRLYLGSNGYRAYGEVQAGAAVGNRASWTYTGGGELSIGGGFWVTAAVGWAESGPRTGRLISHLAIKAGVPGA